MNKFIIGIKLKGVFGLEIELVHWDTRFLWDVNDINKGLGDFYSRGEFMMFSFGEGYIQPTQFVLPEINTYRSNYKLSYSFDTDEARYEYLKNLYKLLSEWGKYWNDMLRDKELIMIEDIIVNDHYWIM